MPVRVGTSSCLLGNRVRYDGGHARARYLTDTLAHHAELVTVCPEVEMGMPTPRPSVRIVEEPAGTDRLVDPKSGEVHGRLDGATLGDNQPFIDFLESGWSAARG